MTNCEKGLLLNDNCINVLDTLGNETIDLVLTDPPYLINYKTNRRKNKGHDFCSEIINDDIDYKELLAIYFSECYRVLKQNTAMYVFSSPKTQHVFAELLIDAGFNIKNRIIWDKGHWTSGDLVAQLGQQYEIIFLVNKGRKPFNGKRIGDVWRFKKVLGKKQRHQNQKPIPLLEQCLLTHSNEGDLVFDGFAGVATTAKACVNTNRSYICVEIDKKYHDIALELLEL